MPLDESNWWDDYSSSAPPDVPYNPYDPAQAEFSPSVEDVSPDDEMMLYASFISEVYKSAGVVGDKPYFKDTSVGSSGGGSAAIVKAEDPGGGDSWVKKLSTAMGFANSNDFAKTMAPAALTVAGAAISGAASGYAANQKRAIDKQLADSQISANQANAALANSRTNQAGLANLKFTPASGMINAPWKPAPLVPPGQRARA